MDSKWLEDFLCLSRCLNFSTAAKERNVTQPAFSRRIRSLENYLGAPLFNRCSTPIELTLYGEQFLLHAQKIMADITEARQEIKAMLPQSSHLLSTVSLHTLAVNIVPRIINSVRDVCPSLAFNVTPSIQGIDNHYSAIVDGQVDLLVTYELPDSSSSLKLSQQLEGLIWSEERFIPVMSKRLAATLTPTSVIPYLHYSEYTFTNALIAKVYKQMEPHLHTVYESTLSESIYNMVLSDTGMAWLPESLVHDALAKGELVTVWPENTALVVRVNIMLYRSQENRRTVLDEFWQAVKRVVNARAGRDS